jgi:outer membrane protein TolC
VSSASPWTNWWGRADVKPNPLRTPVNLESLDPGQIDPWVQNTGTAPMVRKAEVGLKVAKLEVDGARAGHMPTLDAVAQVARTHISSGNDLVKAQSGAGTRRLHRSGVQHAAVCRQRHPEPRARDLEPARQSRT